MPKTPHPKDMLLGAVIDSASFTAVVNTGMGQRETLELTAREGKVLGSGGELKAFAKQPKSPRFTRAESAHRSSLTSAPLSS